MLPGNDDGGAAKPQSRFPQGTPPIIIEVRDQREHPVIRYDLWAAVVAAFPPGEWWRAAVVAWCEARQDPATDTGNGHYGLYQFSLGTWRSVGGEGLPSEASLQEQVARAARLHAARGWQPWACADVMP